MRIVNPTGFKNLSGLSCKFYRVSNGDFSFLEMTKLYRATHGDPSFLGMTNYTKILLLK